ncbi:MAG: hypothetical protein KKG00_14255 [Bacteroidetes bacterium]|nr:hypothetical protein [Bacteroidota bacterium]
MLRPCLLLWLFLSGKALASGDDFPIGARAWGMGNAMVAQADRYAVVNNVAGLATLTEASLFSSFHSYHGFDGLSTLAFGVVLPVRKELVAGFSVQRFGDKIYNELAFGLGVAHRINRVSLGLKIGYRQLAVVAQNVALSRKALVVEMGGIAQLSKTVFFGTHIYNLAQGSYSGENAERLPTVLRTGFTYVPTSSLRLSAEFVKNTDYPASLRAGLEYEVISHFTIRTGINTKPYTNHVGVGFAGDSFAMDYAASSHPQLGWSHHVTLAYTLKKSKEPAAP